MSEQPVLRRGTPIYIEWDDSASYGGWRPDTQGMHVGKVKSLGYVFGANDEGIILVTSLARAPGQLELVGLDPVVIPMGSITTLQVIDMKRIEATSLQLEGVMVREEKLLPEAEEETLSP